MYGPLLYSRKVVCRNMTLTSTDLTVDVEIENNDQSPALVSSSAERAATAASFPRSHTSAHGSVFSSASHVYSATSSWRPSPTSDGFDAAATSAPATHHCRGFRPKPTAELPPAKYRADSGARWPTAISAWSANAARCFVPLRVGTDGPPGE